MSHRTWKAVLALIGVGAMAPAGHATELAGTLAKVKQSASISLGVRETSVPFNYQDDKQQYLGYSLDLCLKIVDEVRKQLAAPEIKVVYTPTTAATRIPLLANGTTDIQCDGASNTADRQKQVAFSPTVFVTGNRLLARKVSKIDKLDDMKGKPIVSMSGTTNIRQIVALNAERKLGMNVLNVTEHSEALLMVETGRAVAYAQDDIHSAALMASSKNPGDFAISEEALSVDPYGLMFRREDPQFKAVVDKAITDLFKSGEITKIYAKWFQSPIPPKGINLNWPISAYLKAAIANPTDSPDPDHYFALVHKAGEAKK
ncbi:amino acid ABC transporter substrate-binding protein [Bosea sp. (in: a-proteobacteria)]|uniref:amino acid ABC transporter substrate-binding protein n=1 Tax=Bosea sp. (in: a-proteobacteria) TaxID=1871050 RepID=UPI002FC849FA